MKTGLRVVASKQADRSLLAAMTHHFFVAIHPASNVEHCDRQASPSIFMGCITRSARRLATNGTGRCSACYSARLAKSLAR